MTKSANPNADQIAYWNATAGDTWTRFNDQLDRQIASLGAQGLARLAARPGEHILDIGCGGGQTSIALARAVAPGGTVTGIDISRPLLALARRHASDAGIGNVDFTEADAQVADLGHARFDAAFSRFGVMFFADPAAAFANIRRSLKPAARLTFVCWQPLAENHWMRLPMEAARPLLPPMPAPDPLAPGPFAFADPARVAAILDAAGYADMAIHPHAAAIGSGNVDETLDLTLRVGPLGAVLREAPELADRVTGAVRDALAAQASPDGQVRLPAAVWIVTAKNPG